MNYGFLIDNRKCIGCHACTTACKSENEVPVGVNRTWVKYVEKGSFPDTRRFRPRNSGVLTFGPSIRQRQLAEDEGLRYDSAREW